MLEPRVENIETRRDQAWIYGDRFVDGEFQSKWMKPIERMSASKQGYGLSEYEAEILTRDPVTADYFERLVLLCRHPSLCAIWLYCQQEKQPDSKFISIFVEKIGSDIPTPSQCAKFIINELSAVAKRHKLEIIDIPLGLAAVILLFRTSRLINNKMIKTIFDQELTKKESPCQ